MLILTSPMQTRFAGMEFVEAVTRLQRALLTTEVAELINKFIPGGGTFDRSHIIPAMLISPTFPLLILRPRFHDHSIYRVGCQQPAYGSIYDNVCHKRTSNRIELNYLVTGRNHLSSSSDFSSWLYTSTQLPTYIRMLDVQMADGSSRCVVGLVGPHIFLSSAGLAFVLQCVVRAMRE